MRDGLEVTLRLQIEQNSLYKCHRVAKGIFFSIIASVD
jgi:hypothetical protein